jgi:hypothetical protein
MNTDNLTPIFGSIIKNHLEPISKSIECIDDVPESIIKEIEESILKHGPCGESDIVSTMPNGVQKQDSNMSFCDVEYMNMDVMIGDNMAEGFVFFPFKGVFIKTPFAL